MKKYILGAVLSFGILVSPAFTQAATLTDAQIGAILSLLSSFGADSAIIANVKSTLTGGSTQTTTGQWCHTFNSNLGIGARSQEISALQTVLAKEGFDAGTSGKDVGLYDETVASAITGFQEKYRDEILTPSRLKNGTGYVGPSTRKKLNQLFGCGGVTNPPVPNKEVGTLEISLGNARAEGAIQVGNTIEAKAEYTPLGPPCPTYVLCSPPAPIPVAVSWSTDRPDILSLKWDGGKGTLASKIFISGLSAGIAHVKAMYLLPSGKALTSDIKIVVTANEQQATSITVLSPNGGESYTDGQTVPISFATTLTDLQTSGVTLQLYRGLAGTSGASFVQTIVSNWIGGSPYQWLIPSKLSAGQYSIYASAPVRATALPEGGVSDTSDAPFNIVTTQQAPAISYISPSAAIIGGTVYVYGSNFDGTTSIVIDGITGQTLVPTLLSSSALSFVVPASVGIGTHTVQVNNKASAFPISNSATLTVVGTYPSFSVVTPSTAWPTGSTQTIQWSSSNYPSTAMVKITLVQDAVGTPPTETPYLSVVVPNNGSTSWTIPTNIVPASNYRLSVTCDNAGLRSHGSCGDGVSRAFSIVAVPSISSISPSQGAAGTVVTIYGANLAEASSVEFYGTSGKFVGSFVPSAVSASSVVFSINAIFAANASPDTYHVGVVTNACPGGCNSNRIGFTLNPSPSAPAITSLNASSASFGSTIFVYGSNFDSTTYIALDGSAGQTITPAFISSSILSFVVPSSVSLGTHTIQVNNKASAFPLSNSVTLTVI
ncbi:IPT/TIG domain-containing protein [Candidatus Kaiserbacteria bacterium]|nr:IPT/TIG domain-containing protein [Candidatus Kaiserbacteria bacterium]